MGTRPLIGVTTSELREAASVQPTREGEPPRREMALGITYMSAIENAGGLPVVMPPLSEEATGPLVERLDAVCLSGGPDLDPAAYHAKPHARLGPTEPELDEFELRLARLADARGLPILAICRGAQALNVSRGGTLHQHLDDHRQPTPADEPSHEVRVAGQSLLGSLLGDWSVPVNSFHHQAVDVLGFGLRAVAWAPDGTIEAVEAPARPFVLGVQWHAECMVGRPEQARLFEALVEAARRRSGLGQEAQAA